MSITGECSLDLCIGRSVGLGERDSGGEGMAGSGRQAYISFPSGIYFGGKRLDFILGGLDFLPLDLLTTTSPETSSLMFIPDTVDPSSSATNPTGVGRGANGGVGILARSICAQLFAGVGGGGGGGGVLGDCVAVLVVTRCDKIPSLILSLLVPGVALGISLR